MSDRLRDCSLANLAMGGWVTALFSPFGYLAMLVASAGILILTLLWESFISKSLRVSAVLMCGLGCIISYLLQPALRSLLAKYIEDFYLQ